MRMMLFAMTTSFRNIGLACYCHINVCIHLYNQRHHITSNQPLVDDEQEAASTCLNQAQLALSDMSDMPDMPDMPQMCFHVSQMYH